jgi:hypothetical protein
MSPMKNQKVTRVVSTKITEEEYDQLHKIGRQYQSLGYIVKASTSEILRCMIRVYIEWTRKYSTKKNNPESD